MIGNRDKNDAGVADPWGAIQVDSQRGTKRILPI